MNIENRVKVAVQDQVERVVPPLPDVEAVLGDPHRRSPVRLVAVPVAATALVGGVVGGADVLLGDGAGTAQAVSLGRFDFSHGLRAYKSPDDDGDVYLAGRRFDASDLKGIDTDATATPYGMVYFADNGQAHLLDEAGYRKPIGPVPDEAPHSARSADRVEATDSELSPPSGGPDRLSAQPAEQSEGTPPEYHPSARADVAGTLAAWTEYYGDHVTIRMYDLSSRAAVATREVPCDGNCADVRVDAVDGGIAFVSTPDGRYAWDPAATSEQWTRVAGTDTEIVDVRENTLLYDGAAPKPSPTGPVDASWRLVRSPALDAELSHDGRHVLDWSSTLAPAVEGGDTVRLDVPRAAEQFTFDTDGSVLAATGGDHPTARVWDCDVQSGACTRLEDVSTVGGNVVFLGNDM